MQLVRDTRHVTIGDTPVELASGEVYVISLSNTSASVDVWLGSDDDVTPETGHLLPRSGAAEESSPPGGYGYARPLPALWACTASGTAVLTVMTIGASA